jgi:diguanylate cyclase (GGDEF)-like protein
MTEPRVAYHNYIVSLPLNTDVSFEDFHAGWKAAKEDIQQTNKEEWDQLNKLAYFDNLTGVRNRNYLTEMNWSLWRYIYMIDLNKLGEINKKFGHIFGDHYIQEVVQKIIFEAEIKAPQEIMVRYGGDEFLVFSDRLLNISHKCQQYTSASTAISSKNLMEQIELLSLKLLMEK